MRVDLSTITTYGLGVAFGLVVMLWAFESVHWYNYMRATPGLGTVSGSGTMLSYVLFLLGAVIASTALLRGVQRVTASNPESSER